MIDATVIRIYPMKIEIVHTAHYPMMAVWFSRITD